MKKITYKMNQHKINLVLEIQNLTIIYLKKVKELNSLFTLSSTKETLSKEIKAIEKELEHKLTVSSMMKGF